MSDKQKRTNRKKAERKFEVTDASLMAQSRVIHKLFTEKMAQFTAFDTDFDAAYAANWFAKIEFCEAIITDETTMHEMAGIKEKLDKKVLALIAKLGEVEFYVLKAFNDDPEILHEFQFNKVNRLDQYSPAFMINVFIIRHFVEHEYNAELTTAGMPPTLVTELNAAGEQVINLEFQHEVFKRIRIKRTRLRIKDMNQLFSLTNAVCKAAKVIFADKPESAGMFEIK